jgi:hypothetical protein
MDVGTIDILKTVGEVGSIGILALYIIIADQKDKRYNKTMNNHLAHMEAATYESANSNKNLASALSNLSTVIQGCPNNKLNK